MKKRPWIWEKTRSIWESSNRKRVRGNNVIKTKVFCKIPFTFEVTISISWKLALWCNSHCNFLGQERKIYHGLKLKTAIVYSSWFPKPWTQSANSTPRTHVKLHTLYSSYITENSTLTSACNIDVRIFLLLLISY